MRQYGIFCIAMTALLLTDALPAVAQDAKTLSAAEVVAIVKQYHPVARQAAVGVEMAKADVTIARGGFDPYFSFDTRRKTFDGIDYYNNTEPQLKIPTWYGIEVSAGTERLSGSRTDPQETAGRTSFAGISVPLLKNLLMDKRRAALQQAKIFTNMSRAEQRSTLNNLLYESLGAYWEWVLDYEVYKIIKNAVAVNEKRFILVKNAWRLGDRPAIDTTEALVQLQQFQYQQNEAWLNFQNAGVALSAWLWQANNQAFDMQADIVPGDKWDNAALVDMPVPDEALLVQQAVNHPDLQQYRFKLAALGVERRLKFQEMLPVLNLKYNQLGKGYDFGKTITAPLFENNFRFGVSFAVPLRLSQGRGEYRKAKLKIADTEYELQQKTLLVQNKIRSYRNEALTLLQQIRLLQRTLANYQALQRGEETRFFNGESSLFLVNSRENKTLEGLQKLVEAKVKFLKTQVAVQWAAGLLN